MTGTYGPALKQRNRNYEETHLLLVEKAGELISQSGADGVSVSALSRVTGLNRSTIYYHFDTREVLMSAAQQWSREQLCVVGEGKVSRWVGIDDLSAAFQDSPNVLSSWIDNYIVAGDIRERFPQWDRLVAQISDVFAELSSDARCDAEDYCALILSSAAMVPGPFRNSKHPLESLKRILGQASHQSSNAPSLMAVSGY